MAQNPRAGFVGRRPVALKAVFKDLRDSLARLREALASVRIAVVEDRPSRGEAPMVDRLADALDDLQGDLAEAIAAAEDAEAAAQSVDAHRARDALALAHDRFIRVEYKFLLEVASRNQFDDLAHLGKSRGGEWAAWVRTVTDSLDRCRTCLPETDRAVLACWRDLSELLG
jgi:hypothetical protein